MGNISTLCLLFLGDIYTIKTTITDDFRDAIEYYITVEGVSL